jgi:nucleotidyltransferase substrate binding protein (TIGR01987 family)
MSKEIRWKQRLQNFEKALSQLTNGVQIAHPSGIERQGVIKSFEFTFELAWKTFKDYLESQNVEVSFPREVIKNAFHYELVDNGEIWMEMLDQRNFLAHTYDEQRAEEAYQKIKRFFYPAVQQAFKTLISKSGS